MTATIIDGRVVATRMTSSVRAEADRLRVAGVPVGLATVSAGPTYAASAYERRLRRLADELGVAYRAEQLPGTAVTNDVIDLVRTLNEDPHYSGVLVLRPLPDGVDETAVFRAIDPAKDVEAVHPENAGLLALGVPRFVPSTAAAAFAVLDDHLDRQGIDLAEFYHHAHIVVIGRSGNVGKPAVSLAYQRQATVESVDEWASKTGRLGRHTRRADVLIVAAGRPGLIRAEHVNEHTIVIDVGINPATAEDGRTVMVGDVDAVSVASRARALTPVPGGVGPVTDVCLLANTVAAALLTGEVSV